MNNRRKLVITLCASALAAPLGSFAQQSTRVYRIGILNVGDAASSNSRDEVFARALRELGYTEGKSIFLERRYANGDRGRLKKFALEFVQLKVDAILANSSFATQAARDATSTIPIVMTGVGNPIQSGFVSSFVRPGGNITGLTNISIDISSKYFELLHEVVPSISRVAVLVNPAHPNHPTVLKQIQAGAKAFGVDVSRIEVPTIDEMGAALNAAVKTRATALIIPADPAFPIKTREIVKFTVTHRLPALFGWSAAVEEGGLIGYQPSVTETYRRAAALVVKILKGAKPAEIPVEQPTKFELLVNTKTATRLGIKIPNSILIRADKVIE